jgi:hypothetical protein
MRTPEQELAYKVLMRDGQWGMTGCLEEARAHVALRGHDQLDDLNQVHVRLLALMCTGMPCDDTTIAIHFDRGLGPISNDGLTIDPKLLEMHLEHLCDIGYAEDRGQGLQPTALGSSLIQQIGREMLGMDKYRMTGELQQLTELLARLR